MKALDVLYRFVEKKENCFIYVFLPIFVAKYGQGHYRQSIKAIRDFTQYSTSEGGVRTFLELDLNQTLKKMQQWTRSKNTHIRRLASEGCRPRLPWAKKVSGLIENPELTWPILDALREDPEKYVQKSVANHLNDISKDHPDWVIRKIRGWNLKHPVTRWIVTHGTRTLIKQGHKGALALNGNHHKPQVTLENVLWNNSVKLGGICQLSLDVISKSKKSQSLVIDYQIYFCKSNGKLKPKTFKLKKYTLMPNEKLSFGYVFLPLSVTGILRLLLMRPIESFSMIFFIFTSP